MLLSWRLCIKPKKKKAVFFSLCTQSVPRAAPDNLPTSQVLRRQRLNFAVVDKHTASSRSDSHHIFEAACRETGSWRVVANTEGDSVRLLVHAFGTVEASHGLEHIDPLCVCV